MAQVIPIEGPTFLVAEDLIGHLRPAPSECFNFPRSQQGFQSLSELGRHIDSAGSTALGRGDATSYAVAPNFDKPPVEINIAPLKTQQFPQTQARSQCAEEQWVFAGCVLAGVLQEQRDFFADQRANLRLLLVTGTMITPEAKRRIGLQEAIFDSLTQNAAYSPA